ncbi:high affinity immunoglobulin gamma Fc receptor I-like isoform X2 [Pelobates fuscus]|uniref:high affinity immunoglobulin gamma Fc receptor I-like isoform X2 n=1 Tax=Pelobates fuscus TaxID=191477 RepID=UPI002FE4AB98
MSALALVLLVLIFENSGAQDKLVVSFTPNWASIIRGESINMTCNGADSTQFYVWYKDQKLVKVGLGVNQYSIDFAYTWHSGDYLCETVNATSDPVRLDVRNVNLLLQVPHSVYEGDSVSLRCHSYPGYSAGGTIFYNKDNEIIQSTGEETLSLEKISMGAAGHYSCKKTIFYGNQNDHQHIAEGTLAVKELFSSPHLDVNPQEVTNGANMTLTCNRMSKSAPDLLFAFYRGKKTVKEFSPSNKYQVWSTKPNHSGNYTCEVRTSNYNVKKRSPVLHIQIQAHYPLSGEKKKFKPNKI